MNTDKGFYI